MPELNDMIPPLAFSALVIVNLVLLLGGVVLARRLLRGVAPAPLEDAERPRAPDDDERPVIDLDQVYDDIREDLFRPRLLPTPPSERPR